GRDLMGAAQKARPGGRAHPLSISDVDRGQGLRKRKLLIDGGREAVAPKPASERDDGVHDRRRDLRFLSAPSAHAASRFGPSPSGPSPLACWIRAPTPCLRTRSRSSWDFSSEPSERSVTSGSTSSAPSARRDSVQSRVSPTPGTR